MTMSETQSLTKDQKKAVMIQYGQSIKSLAKQRDLPLAEACERFYADVQRLADSRPEDFNAKLLRGEVVPGQSLIDVAKAQVTDDA